MHCGIVSIKFRGKNFLLQNAQLHYKEKSNHVTIVDALDHIGSEKANLPASTGWGYPNVPKVSLLFPNYPTFKAIQISLRLYQCC